jgi:hypothetical protein
LQRSEQKGRQSFAGVQVTLLPQVGQATLREAAEDWEDWDAHIFGVEVM